MSYSPLSAVQPHSLSSVCICSSEVAMSYAWLALELLLFPAPCAAACAGGKKNPGLNRRAATSSQALPLKANR